MEITPGTMKITLNGNQHPIQQPLSLSDLLKSLNLDGKPIVAELNHSPILPKDFSTTTIRDGDQLELVTLAAGG